jgi:hypothetical protein
MSKNTCCLSHAAAVSPYDYVVVADAAVAAAKAAVNIRFLRQRARIYNNTRSGSKRATATMNELNVQSPAKQLLKVLL